MKITHIEFITHDFGRAIGILWRDEDCLSARYMHNTHGLMGVWSAHNPPGIIDVMVFFGNYVLDVQKEEKAGADRVQKED